MKFIKHTILSFALFFCALALNAQHAPAGINYQAVLRDPQGQIIADQAIKVKISVNDPETRSTFYTETHTVTTNNVGIFSVVIGGGRTETGAFKDIPWSTANTWLEVAYDTDNNGSYEITGTTRMLSVPYAFYAEKAGSAENGTSANPNGAKDGGGPIGDGWLLKGNDNIDEKGNYLGTNNYADLVIKTANVERMRITKGVGGDGHDALIDLQEDVTADKSMVVGETLTVGKYTLLNDELLVVSNTSVGGNLDVAGNTSVGGTMDIAKQLDVHQDVVVDGGLDVQDNSEFEGDVKMDRNLYVNQNVFVKQDITVQGTGKFYDIEVEHNAHIGNDVDIDHNLNVDKSVHIGGNTDIDSDLNVDNNTKIGRDLEVANNAAVDVNLFVGHDLLVNHDATIFNDFRVFNDATVNHNLNVDVDAHIHNNLYVDKNANINGDLDVNGTGQFLDLVLERDLKVGRDADIDRNLNVDVNAHVGQDLDVDRNLNVDVNAHVGQDLDVDRDVNIDNNLTVDFNAYIGQDLSVTRDLTVMDDLTADGDLTINGDALFAKRLSVSKQLNANCRLRVNSCVSGSDNDPDDYPVHISGGNQGIFIEIGGTRSTANNFVTFADNLGIQGRIEGQTLDELHGNFEYVWAQSCSAVDFALKIAMVIACAAQADVGEVAVWGVEGAAMITKWVEWATSLETNVGVAYESGNGDYAEWLERENPAEKLNYAEIIGVRGGKISHNTEGADHVLVVSMAPIVLGNMPAAGREQDFEKVAFMGQVPVKVMGKVAVGDYILPSGNNDGYGKAVNPAKMRTEDYASIVGVAWQAGNTFPMNIVNVAVGLNSNDMAGRLAQQERELSDVKAQVNQLFALLGQKAPYEIPASIPADSKVLNAPVASVENPASTTSPSVDKLDMNKVLEDSRPQIEALFAQYRAKFESQGVDLNRYPEIAALYRDPIQWLKDQNSKGYLDEMIQKAKMEVKH